MLDQACRHPEAKPYLPKGCGDNSIPRIPHRLLYGTLSDEIHRPDVRSVFVMSNETEEYKVFFEAFCKLSDLRFEVIDAGSARSPE